ncbi:universal stress protein [Pseudonocardia sp. WMMC193]|uniref:universal stress protein n=1 Tax=Pseudonocardia sp. WMMC193 TaxID=2911965 RepID=UPI001F26BB22|nr:universal stress protein [Pseudonocardia sp. WMMC193]MCF7553183.1 universal stress protein [Pseudonocardia sp. WMMC193]
MSAIVLGYDSSPGAARALDLAVELASSLGAPLVLVHGVAPPGQVGEEAGEARHALESLAQEILAPAVETARAAGVPVTTELVADQPAAALVKVADAHDARVIVVGTWNESPWRGALFGSVAHKLLQVSDRPVLCVPAAV